MFVKTPWPLPFEDREAFLEASGFLLESEGAIIFTIVTERNNNWFGTELKRDPKNVEFIYN
jgi:hypothetical protein